MFRRMLAPAAPAKRQAEESTDVESKRQRFEEEKVQRDKERLAAKLDGSKATTTAARPKEGAEWVPYSGQTLTWGLM